MNPKCIKAVQDAAGRKLTDGEIKKIDDSISATMRRLAREDPSGWAAKSQDQRVTEAAQLAMVDIQSQAALKVQRAQLQIVKTAAMENRVGDLMAQFAEGRNNALVREMDQSSNYIEGIKRESMSHLIDLMDAATSKEGASTFRNVLMFLFDSENPGMSRDMATEIFRKADGSTGNKLAQDGAKAWLETVETLRQRFNAGGGDVGMLDYGYLPQPHDQGRVRGSGDATARDKWVQKVMPILDRSRYLLEDGSRMQDAQVVDLLNTAWQTIATGGLNKLEPGKNMGNGARANAGSESRQIHFKDADAYLGYLKDFGGGSMYDAMMGHIGGITRDIGLVERYGPNPSQQMRLQFDQAKIADVGVKRSFMMKPESYWDVLSGKTGMAENGNLAKVAQDIRNVETFGKLQGAVISSITDVGTYFITTGYNKLSYWESIKNIGRQFGSETRDFLTMHGVIAETMVSDLNRWSGDNIRNNWSGRLANSTMKLSLMNAWTDTLRRSFSMTLMNGMAKLSKTEWGKLSEWDRTHMERKGITEADWNVIRAGELTEYRGTQFLTPEAIRAGGHERSNEVVAKVLGFITDESEYAVINPDLATKALQSGGGLSKGTVTGELARSVMQFKSFPVAMISRHWRRMLDAPQGLEGAPMLANRLMYGGALLTSLTALGAIAFQTKQIVQGKDPIDMSTPKFWTRAMAQGGGFGIVGDFLLTDPTENPGDATANAIKTVAGPGIGSVFDISYKLGIENVYETAKGKDAHFWAETARVSRSHLPYLNLWYAKAAFDHAGLHALQENVSPGYLSRMQSRAQKEWGQSYWWRPDNGHILNGTVHGPDRAPNMSKAVGG